MEEVELKPENAPVEAPEQPAAGEPLEPLAAEPSAEPAEVGPETAAVEQGEAASQAASDPEAAEEPAEALTAEPPAEPAEVGPETAAVEQGEAACEPAPEQPPAEELSEPLAAEPSAGPAEVAPEPVLVEQGETASEPAPEQPPAEEPSEPLAAEGPEPLAEPVEAAPEVPAMETAEAGPEEVAPSDQMVLDAQPVADQDDTGLKAVVEAIVYITEEPVSAAQIAAAIQQPEENVQRVLEELTAEFARSVHGVMIREVAGGYKMTTKPEHHETLRAFVKSLKPPLKLSLAALETLATIAYKQPITAPEIMEIRGVQGAGVLKTLLDRKLIQTSGRKNVIGRPILYRTTKEFLVQFGLKDLAELPTLKEFEELRRLAVGEPEAEAPEQPETAPEQPPAEAAAPETEPAQEPPAGEEPLAAEAPATEAAPEAISEPAPENQDA